MPTKILTLNHWEALSPSERLAAAFDLLTHLPSGFRFDRLESCSLGPQTHPVAFFHWQPSGAGYPGAFALIPGGDVILGYDRNTPFVPTVAQAESWRDTQNTYDLPDLPDYLDQCLTPLRTVSLAPFLMETTLIDTEDAPALFAKNARDGFRLPTSDEWEWACAAGAKTLWRWGDDCPTDGYPGDQRNRANWNKNLVPNAFGLTIADNDYHQEWCDGDISRGGDGGASTCGGAGYFIAWLTLAPAFVLQDGQETRDLLKEFGQVRRVFSLG